MLIPGAVVVVILVLFVTIKPGSIKDIHANALCLSLERPFPFSGFHFIKSLMDMSIERAMPQHLSELLTE